MTYSTTRVKPTLTTISIAIFIGCLAAGITWRVMASPNPITTPGSLNILPTLFPATAEEATNPRFDRLDNLIALLTNKIENSCLKKKGFSPIPQFITWSNFPSPIDYPDYTVLRTGTLEPFQIRDPNLYFRPRPKAESAAIQRCSSIISDKRLIVKFSNARRSLWLQWRRVTRKIYESSRVNQIVEETEFCLLSKGVTNNRLDLLDRPNDPKSSMFFNGTLDRLHVANTNAFRKMVEIYGSCTRVLGQVLDRLRIRARDHLVIQDAKELRRVLSITNRYLTYLATLANVPIPNPIV